MKVRIVHGGIGTYEVQMKKYLLTPWQTVYSGIFPWRGSLQEAKKLRTKLILKYS